MQNRKTSLFTLSLALVLTAACSRTKTDTASPDVSTTPPPSDTTPTQTGEAAGQAETTRETEPQTPVVTNTPGNLPPGAVVEAPPEYKTTDDEIFGVLETINDEAIEQAELAKKWSKSQKVKKFAADMRQTHMAANDREKAIRDRLGLRSTDSKLSDDIENNSEQKVDTLKEVPKGDPFDASFVDVQVENYARWIEFIDTKLLPQAQMPDLRNELNALRSTLETQLNAARELQTTLNKPRT